MFLYLIHALAIAQPAPFVSTTDDGGMQLAAYGTFPPIV